MGRSCLSISASASGGRPPPACCPGSTRALQEFQGWMVKGAHYFPEVFSGVDNSRSSRLEKDVIKGKREAAVPISWKCNWNPLRLRAGRVIPGHRVKVVHSAWLRECQKRTLSKIIFVRSVTPANLLCEIHLDSPVLAPMPRNRRVLGKGPILHFTIMKSESLKGWIECLVHEIILRVYLNRDNTCEGPRKRSGPYKHLNGKIHEIPVNPWITI